jgi:hypothetical protein
MLKNRDVRRRISRDDQKVGVLAWIDRPDLLRNGEKSAAVVTVAELISLAGGADLFSSPRSKPETRR